ncbi:DUF4199 domain-containing protein [Confluentibacter sediminis]|uniref:DUF4199 domain-containing protein n=1 Tax=Confluentibacter sediminis TaxID=2219045 RepID=UPI000DAD269A|nr:DUF4199 domain-containing protein [Confluentibacter sediminis]
MESEIKSPGKFAVNYGIILGLILVVIYAVMYATNMLIEGKQWPMVLFYVIFPTFLIYTISQFKKTNNNLLTLSDALKVGVAAAVISALVYAVFSLVLFYVIDTELMSKMMEAAREKLYENPKMTSEMVEKNMEMAEKFSSPLLGAAVWIALSALFGLIYSLIAGLVMKKESQE